MSDVPQETPSTTIRDFKRYAIIVDGEYTCSLLVPHTMNEKAAMQAAALSSNPVIVDITGMFPVPPDASGWLWTGSEFVEGPNTNGQ